MMQPLDLDLLADLAVAALVGLAVGVEREWSGHASGPNMRFAGVRTFLLLGILGGFAGWLVRSGVNGPALALIAGAGALIVTAYALAARRGNEAVEATTEVAALVVLGLATAAGLGQARAAAGATAIVVLVLAEKQRFHGMVRRIGEKELRAALQFAVLALVILPLLPTGPYGPYGGIRPRALWMLVLLISGLNFIGYLGRRAIGARRGYAVTGLLGGLVSSTAVALQFSKQSRSERKLAAPLARGVIGACTILFPRVLVIAAILNFAVALALLRWLALPTLIGAVAMLMPWPGDARTNGGAGGESSLRSPLDLRTAVQMAVLFQVALLGIAFMSERFGAAGVLATSAVLGLTDVDALTVAMTRLGLDANGATLGARAIAVGILSNTLVKLGIALSLGSAEYRLRAGIGIAAIAAALGAGLLLLD